jgi:hypothetical protein
LTDYNFGTLIRKNSEEAYGQDNTIFVTRVQFFAIEVGMESKLKWMGRPY